MDERALEAAREAVKAALAEDVPEGVYLADFLADRAIAAYEAALWRPIEDHDGSRGVIMLEYETPHGDLKFEPAWYEDDEMEKGWWGANLGWRDYHAETFEERGCVPRRFRPLPTPPGGA